MEPTTIIFTAIPSSDPAPAGQVRLTVLVAPRLYASGTADRELGFFKDLAGTPWPTRLAAASFQVRYGAESFRPAQLAPPRRAVEAREAALWSSLFPDRRRVIPYTPDDYSKRKMIGFPLGQLHDDIIALYTAAAGAASQGVERLPLTARMDDGGVDEESVSYLDNFVHRWANVAEGLQAHTAPGANLKLESRVYAALRFYTRKRRLRANEPPRKDVPDPEKYENFDFHEMVALIGDHPTLMRKLGLVFDLLVPVPIATSGTVEVRVGWRSGPGDHYPRTHFTWDGARFLPAAQATDRVNRGYLRLDNEGAFKVMQLDVDGSVLKLSDFAVATRNRIVDITAPPPEGTTLPALRSAGLTIAQHERVTWLLEAHTRQNRAHGLDNVELWAEDLMRGYRLDIEGAEASWCSLHRRFGTIRVGTAGTVKIDADQEEEGYVKATSTVAGPEDEKEMYLHDAVAGWSGYSLSARAPGLSIVHGQGKVEVTEDVGNLPGSVIDIQADYLAKPRSLPRLRFGQAYRVRARVTDVAGGGLGFADRDASAASKVITYRRFEPVGTPILVHKTPITEAESLEHMVMRSIPSQAENPYAYMNVRHILPPKAPLAMVEAHGKLDDAMATRDGAKTVYLLARREAGTITDIKMPSIDGPEDDLVVPDVELRNKPSAKTAVRSDQPGRGVSLEDGQYVLHKGELATLTYLPDPMAEGVAFWSAKTGLVKMSWKPVTPGSSIDWARPQPMRIEIGPQIASGARYSKPAANVLLIHMAPGERVELFYASTLHELALQHMEVWNLLTASQRADVETRRRVLDGKSFMMTPARKLVLVHAVQRPLRQAWFSTDTIVTRQLGSTVARLEGSVEAHTPSTGHIDVRSSWLEVIDLPHEPAPREEERRADIARVPVTDDLLPAPLMPVRMKYKRGRKRFPIFYLSYADDSKVREPTQHELGDTKCRVIDYNPVSTTRYLEYFPPAVIADRANVEITGTIRRFVVPATAAPAPPVVAQILPAFRFTPGTKARSRMGGAVRIYLERPWCSSGTGERLAVLVHPTGADPLGVDRQLYSQWGRDPVWKGGAPSPLSIAMFRPSTTEVIPLGSRTKLPLVQIVRGVSLPGSSKKTDLVGVLPVFNHARGLWYCDIELNKQEAYFPFLSLSLARYQPNALEGAQLSALTRAEFVQLTPDRHATVIAGATNVDVKLTGVSVSSSMHPTAHALKVFATVQWCATGGSELTGPGPIAWTELNPTTSGTVTTWAGKVPRPAAQAGMKYRVVLFEHESHPDVSQGLTGASGMRVTYLDVFPL